MHARRLGDGPIIRPGMDARMGANINGPSLIRAPDWLPNAPGRYLLYFADHHGTYIRLAYADSLTGPWRTHEPGTLRLEQTPFPHTTDEFNLQDPRVAAGLERGHVYPHIASPDVHVDEQRREIRMYFHGALSDGRQRTRAARSRDGLHFEVGNDLLANSYLRMLPRERDWIGMAMPGILCRSDDGLTDFEHGPQLFGDDMRHCALLQRGGALWVFWTQVGHAPERILVSAVDTRGGWQDWRAGPAQELLRPEFDWEGASAPLAPSVRGWSPEPVNQLRDPAIFVEDERVYLLYAVQGERGIALAELEIA